jgi:polyisoprenyl-phosphate glycosyltransferase
MKNFTIILPVFNDWKSLNVLLKRIEDSLKNYKKNFKILLINDCSTEKNIYRLNKNKFFKEIKILNLKKNIGSQKAIATALKYLSKDNKNINDKFIIMDSDGEDDPGKIKKILNLLKINNEIKIITLNRTIRKESFIFSILYEMHLFITFLLTFNYIRFGNFSYIDKQIIKKLSSKEDLWLAYSATLNKFFKNKHSILASRKKRICGISKMSFLSLIKHSLSIQAVYRKNVFFSFTAYSLIIIFFFNIFLSKIIIGIFICYFIILINLTKKIINGVTFNQCLNNIKSIKNI